MLAQLEHAEGQAPPSMNGPFPTTIYVNSAKLLMGNLASVRHYATRLDCSFALPDPLSYAQRLIAYTARLAGLLLAL